MKTFHMKTFSDLHAQTEANLEGTTLYRGQRNIDWMLIPKIGRLKPRFDHTLSHVETSCFLRSKIEQLRFSVLIVEMNGIGWQLPNIMALLLVF